jgi:hypothetical protein
LKLPKNSPFTFHFSPFTSSETRNDAWVEAS